MIALTLMLAFVGLEASPAPASPAPHVRSFWKGIVGNGYAVPAGESPAALIQELSGYLGSPDRELRDEFAYAIPVQWIYRDKRLAPGELRGLLQLWSANLELGLGDSGNDTVLLRSFSTLDLSILAALDNERPFLTDAEFQGLLAQGLRYLEKERDVRGYDERVGWIHATAHTADLLKFLSRNTKLKATDQKRIVEEIAAKLEGAGSVFTHGEDERLARALLSLARRPDFDPSSLLGWCQRLKAAETSLRDAPVFDHDRFIALQNEKNSLKSLAVLLAGEKTLTVAGKEVEASLIAVLVG
ncbi:MAG TPA: DUF2785 domain-containing protein [Vicinamibacteria bacterium]|nr:DUF2785 domain-containing protein [Vicinamibacteria bacterium]